MNGFLCSGVVQVMQFIEKKRQNHRSVPAAPDPVYRFCLGPEPEVLLLMSLQVRPDRHTGSDRSLHLVGVRNHHHRGSGRFWFFWVLVLARSGSDPELFVFSRRLRSPAWSST